MIYLVSFKKSVGPWRWIHVFFVPLGPKLKLLNKTMKRIMLTTLLLTAMLSGKAFQTDTLMTHDPVMAYEDGTYYLLSTGMGISWATSKDRKSWVIHLSSRTYHSGRATPFLVFALMCGRPISFARTASGGWLIPAQRLARTPAPSD